MASNMSGGESTALFKVPTLTGLEDYFQWKTAMTDSLLMLGALDIVEGTELPPIIVKAEKGYDKETNIEDNKKDIKSWVDRDRKAMAVMRRTISDALKIDIEDCRSSKAIWDRLVELHDLTAPEYRAEVRRELLNYFLLEGTDLKDHLDGFLRLLLKASGAGIRFTDEEKCLMFLDTLPASFDMLKLQWRMMPVSVKTFVELRRQYNLEGAQRARTQARSLAAAMLVTSARPGKGSKRPAKNQEDGKANFVKNGETENKGKGKRDVAKVRCFRCHELGHYKRDCPQRSGKSGEMNMVSPSGPFIGLACCVSVDPMDKGTVAMVTATSTRPWIIDSGATHHIVSDVSLLTDKKVLHSPLRFGLATREGSMTASITGSVQATAAGAQVVLTNVMFVEEARCDEGARREARWRKSKVEEEG